MSKTLTRLAPRLLFFGIAAAGAVEAGADPGRTDPTRIDRIVEAFTGTAIGQPGGARQPADRRLQLAPCTSPLQASWHGAPGRTVRVACNDGPGWQVFVALQPLPATANAAPAVKRGDRLTVTVRGRGFTIQQPGEAAEAGLIGDWITVRMAQGQKTVSARIERAGLATIDNR